MRKKLKVWFKGLVAGVISGGANAIGNALTATMVAPQTFNLADQLIPTIKLACASWLFGAITGASLYLKQSPVPPSDTDDLPVVVPPPLPPADSDPPSP